MSTFASQLEPLRLPAFRNLFLATMGSSVGTLMAAAALTLDVQGRTQHSPHTGLWVGAVLVVEFLPTVVIGLFFGPLLDRLERRSLMIAADAIRVGVFVALPFAPGAGAVVGLALVAGLATGFFRPAVYASVPNLVDDAASPAGERAPPDRREPQLDDRAGPRRRRRHRRSRTASTPRRSSSRSRSSSGSRRVSSRASAR